MSGKTISHYRIIERLGRCGTGVFSKPRTRICVTDMPSSFCLLLIPETEVLA
jgi:hypothetical protein